MRRERNLFALHILLALFSSLNEVGIRWKGWGDGVTDSEMGVRGRTEQKAEQRGRDRDTDTGVGTERQTQG